MFKSPRLVSLLFPLLFEVYFLSVSILYYVRNGLPENNAWIITVFVKIVLGYLVYRMYLSRYKQIFVGATVLVLFLIVATLVIHFINPDFSSIVGGFTLVQLTANSFFIFRYLRNYQPILLWLDIITKFKNGYSEVNLIITLLVVAWAIIEVLIGSESGLIQWGTILFWIVIYASIEGIKFMKKRGNVSNNT